MKNLMILTTLFASTQALALSPRSSWLEIFSSREAIVTVDYASFQEIALENACLTANSIQSKVAVPVCVKMDVKEVEVPDSGSFKDYRCTQYEKHLKLGFKYFVVQPQIRF